MLGLLFNSFSVNSYTNPTTSSTNSDTTPVTESTFPLPALIGGIAGLLALVVLIFVIVIVVVSIKHRCVAKRKKKQNNHANDPTYNYPDELPPPLPQRRTNQIQVTTIYETIMDTTNPAYGLTLSASAGISVDTNIAYDIIKDILITATNGAQQQDETPATNPTFEDASDFVINNCPRVTHPTYKEEVYSLND